jgi:hypothetical protein
MYSSTYQPFPTMNNARMNPLKVLALAALPRSVTGRERHFATDGVHQLEQAYVNDCATVDITPHGYYGAFLQPCEFQFRHTIEYYSSGDPCSDEASTLVSTPVPVNWLFDATFMIDSWDKMSSDDFPYAEELFLWPDQCVVAPRCYAVVDETIHGTLARIFSHNGWLFPREQLMSESTAGRCSGPESRCLCTLWRKALRTGLSY